MRVFHLGTHSDTHTRTLALALAHTHTHTHTHLQLYMCSGHAFHLDPQRCVSVLACFDEAKLCYLEWEQLSHLATLH